MGTGLMVYDFIAEKIPKNTIDFLHVIVNETPPVSMISKSVGR